MSVDERSRRPSTPPPWYASGVRFECLPECGRCCSRHDDFAYVYLEPDDIRSLAAHLGLSVREFRRRWTFREEGHTALRIEGPACPFLDGTRCAVYEARPRQCRSFPFWSETMASRESWESLASFCPGIGQGDLLPLASIRMRTRGEG